MNEVKTAVWLQEAGIPLAQAAVFFERQGSPFEFSSGPHDLRIITKVSKIF
ncbi:hypothetical protein [Paenibacillus camerounensis]|uniref:hypothetical protein n=1 Tax=Paenibacillus camerounensis TaxID=1243663 RepID=UPI000A8C5C75|nr:hypothetical protein [Paenibacillus camerounensis]